MLTRLLAFTLALLGLCVQLPAQANFQIVESGFARPSLLRVIGGEFVHLMTAGNVAFVFAYDYSRRVTTISAFRNGEFIRSVSDGVSPFRGPIFIFINNAQGQFDRRHFQVSVDGKSLYMSPQCSSSSDQQAPIGNCQSLRWDFETGGLSEVIYAGEKLRAILPHGEFDATVQTHYAIGYAGGSLNGKEYVTLRITSRGKAGETATIVGLFEIFYDNGQKKLRQLTVTENVMGGYVTGSLTVVTPLGQVFYQEQTATNTNVTELISYDTNTAKREVVYSNAAFLAPSRDLVTGDVLLTTNIFNSVRRILPKQDLLFSRGDLVGSYMANNPEPFKQNGLGTVGFTETSPSTWYGVAIRQNGSLRLFIDSNTVVAGRPVGRAWGSFPHQCSVEVVSFFPQVFQLDRIIEARPVVVKSAEALENGQMRLCGCNMNLQGTSLDTVTVNGLTTQVVSRTTGLDGYDVVVLAPLTPVYGGNTIGIGLTIQGKTFTSEVRTTGLEAPVEPPPPPPPTAEEPVGTRPGTASPPTPRRGSRF